MDFGLVLHNHGSLYCVVVLLFPATEIDTNPPVDLVVVTAGDDQDFVTRLDYITKFVGEGF
jgi:hypothetical protein